MTIDEHARRAAEEIALLLPTSQWDEVTTAIISRALSAAVAEAVGRLHADLERDEARAEAFKLAAVRLAAERDAARSQLAAVKMELESARDLLYSSREIWVDQCGQDAKDRAHAEADALGVRVYVNMHGRAVYEAWPSQMKALTAQLAVVKEERDRLKSVLNNLRSYVAVEGYSGNEGTLVVGLAYEGSIWGPVCQPNTQPYELAEAVEKWLHAKIDTAIREPIDAAELSRDGEGTQHD